MKSSPVGMRCLIVDDSHAFFTAASTMLGSAGIEVVGTAPTLAAAVQLARETTPDLILVDIDLGGESGFDVVEAIDALQLDPLPSMIMISTHDEDDFVDMVEASAAVGFVPKFALSVDLIMRATSR